MRPRPPIAPWPAAALVVAALVLAPLLLASAAGAASAGDERPATIPTRDVDVIYVTSRPDASPGARPLEQRMRWAVSTSLLRVDPPVAGMYFVMNYKTHRLETVREKERMVVEMDAAGAGITMGAPAGAAFKRKDDAVVAGLACTEWETRDASGQPALACLTADGVLLRAVAGGRTLVEASTVHYGQIDSRVFDVPADYRHIVPPPPDTLKATRGPAASAP